MISTMISLAAVLALMGMPIQSQAEVVQDEPLLGRPARSSVPVRLRTVDAQGRRLANCQVHFVKADAGSLRPAIRPEHIVVRSNDRGIVSTGLPVGHAWRVFAWTKRSGGPMATAFVELARLGDVRDLVSYREIRILTSHPDLKLASFPMRLNLWTTFKAQPPLPRHILESQEQQRGMQTLHSLPPVIPLRVSSLASQLRILIHTQRFAKRIPRPKWGVGRLDLGKDGLSRIELEWR